jgi:general secretion pathway protein M
MKMILDRIRYPQLLFVLCNLATIAVVACAVVLPVNTFFSDRDERIADQSKVLARLRGIVAQETNIRAIASDTKAQLQSGEFLNGTNENVVNADLQTRLRALTEGAGTRSRSVQALAVKGADQVRYVGSRIEIVGPIQSLQRAVYAIESAKPYLFITAAAIRNVPAVSRPGVAEEPAISQQLHVYGAMQIAGRDQ